jgi:hypothetical protein
MTSPTGRGRRAGSEQTSRFPCAASETAGRHSGHAHSRSERTVPPPTPSPAVPRCHHGASDASTGRVVL